MRLLLFDIDGTLIHSNRAGRAALVNALESVFGTSGPIDSYQMAGKTDPLIISELLQAAGISPEKIAARLDEVYNLMAEQGKLIFPQKKIRPCAGVIPLLERLQEQEDVTLGLVTGNISLTAPLKLSAAGIDPALFRVGAYGSDAQDRNLLPAMAIERAALLTELPFAGKHTVVIGDTPADILCARAANATAVAVATGTHSTNTLAQYSPNYLLENLAETDKVLEILLNHRSDEADE